jgi:hypothetical protein
MAKKRSVWLVAGLALAGQISAFGAVTGIDLLREEHWVWGSAGSATQDYPGGTEASYNQTSSDPLDVSVIGTYMDRYFGAFPLTARSKAGDFGVEAQGVYWFSRAYARSIYVFTPQAEVSALDLELSGSGFGVGLGNETNVGFALDDLTAGTSVMSLVAPDDPVSPSSEDTSDWDWPPRTWSLLWNRTCPIDPTHTYAVTLCAFAGGGDDVREACLDLEVCPVIPAPGALLLAVLGAALVGSRRRSAA